MKHKAQSCTLLHCRGTGAGGEEELWVGQLRLLCSFLDERGVRREAALVLWYADAAADARRQRGRVPADAPPSHRQHPSQRLRMQRLQWARVGGSPHPHFDVVALQRLRYPVFLQPDASKDNHFWLNPWVTPYSAAD